MSTFQKWFTTFLSEKEIDMSDYCIAGDGSELQVGDICSAIMSQPTNKKVLRI
jgi:hypothetical protein